MVQQHALIRRLPAVETLGSVTFICSDKTGTLTQNRMQVDRVLAAGETRPALPDTAGAPWRELGLAMALCNDAVAAADGQLSGDPTETGACSKPRKRPDSTSLHGRNSLPRLAEIALRFRAGAHDHAASRWRGSAVLVKGAPEGVLALCADQLDAQAAPRRSTRGAAGRGREAGRAGPARAGVRAEAAASVSRTRSTPPTVESGLTFLGLVGLIDPPRPEAAEAVAACKAAGIMPVMITGDHPATARAIAGRLGIIEDGGKVLTGGELARLSLEDFEREVESRAGLRPRQPGTEDQDRAGAAGQGRVRRHDRRRRERRAGAEDAPTSASPWARAAPTWRARPRT